ncbi:hypothetical protein EXS57_01905 [Candidatus Kaiserbacteria bacterium]|nr:hypothetical protein [Candidatus Kaiserbacteria bacterium]
MSHKRLLVASTIIACVVFIGFILSVPLTRDIGGVTAQKILVNVPSVTLRDVYKKGIHTITGSLEVSNSCTTATVQASLSGTGSILVEVNSPEDIGICLQVPTRITFTTSIVAPAALPIIATVNGSVATTTDL